MSTRVDALRNTLDHLALDPRASEDRRYLVSMLRRLGYSDAEIEAQIGPIGGGPRVIEVEYEPAEGRTPERPLSRETTFQVSAPDDGLSFRLSDDHAPAGAGVEEVHHTDLSGVDSDLGDWGDDYEQGPRDDFTSVDDAVGEPAGDFEDFAWDEGPDRFTYDEPEAEEAPAAPELVEFRVVRRPDPAVAAGWQEVAPGEETEAAEAPALEEWSDGEAAWAEPEPEAAWPEQESDDAWAAPESEAAQAWPEQEPEAVEAWPEAETAEAWPEQEPEAADAWPEPEAEELVPWPEAEDAGADAAWPEEAPQEDVWTDEAPLQEAGTEQGWEEVEPTEVWQDVEPAAEAAPDAPYRHGDYTLYTREVHLSTGREQRIYFFAKNQPQSGEPCTLPDGYEVIENDKTGLPFLRRQR